jgi:multiple sugar transport system ATP-binding protein
LMVAAVEPTVRATVHDRVRLAVDADRLHFFDDGSGVAI